MRKEIQYDNLAERQAIKEANIGKYLAKALKLRRSKEYSDRYQTTWGTKTAWGVYLTVKRIIEEGKVSDE